MMVRPACHCASKRILALDERVGGGRFAATRRARDRPSSLQPPPARSTTTQRSIAQTFAAAFRGFEPEARRANQALVDQSPTARQRRPCRSRLRGCWHRSRGFDRSCADLAAGKILCPARLGRPNRRRSHRDQPGRDPGRASGSRSGDALFPEEVQSFPDNFSARWGQASVDNARG
jgi:hypothetical protein